MSASFFPSLFVPIVGVVFPFVTIGWFLIFVDKDSID